jgi:hypothetical protein
MAAIDWPGPSEWSEWMEWLSSGLHGRNRWRLPLLLTGILFAFGRRTVTTWLRAAGISDDYGDYYYFLSAFGRKTSLVARNLLTLVLRTLPLPERVLLVVDDTPTKRYGPFVEGADIHRNPTPGPADQEYLYGHIWVVMALAVRHSLWGALALPLHAALYVRRRTLAKVPGNRGWKFRTKLQLAVQQLKHVVPILKYWGKTVWLVADGAYANRSFLQPAAALQVTVISRLRRNARLFSVPSKPTRRRGRPRIYGTQRIALAKRAGQPRAWQTITCRLYGHEVTKRYKTFLATYAPAGGLIRVVLVKEEQGWAAFFCTDAQATVQEILEGFSDRATIEQCFHDQKEIWGTGKQQVRNIWTNVAVFNMNLIVHTLVELWAWALPHDRLRDRSASPWDDPDRRPSHADRRKALRQLFVANELNRVLSRWLLPRKIIDFARQLAQFATAV